MSVNTNSKSPWISSVTNKCAVQMSDGSTRTMYLTGLVWAEDYKGNKAAPADLQLAFLKEEVTPEHITVLETTIRNREVEEALPDAAEAERQALLRAKGMGEAVADSQFIDA